MAKTCIARILHFQDRCPINTCIVGCCWRVAIIQTERYSNIFQYMRMR